MENKIKVQNANLGAGMQISVANTDYAVSVTNNRAQYYAEQAKKYRDDAKNCRDEAKYYSEQNSNVTTEYVDGIKSSLIQQINTKQMQGDYALKSEIPQNVSSLTNDSNYLKKSEFGASADEYLLNLSDTAKTVLQENGGSWGHIQGEISAQTDLQNTFAQKLDLSASNLNTAGKKKLSGLAMPSQKYIDLNLLASNGVYTVPADGYLTLAGSSTATDARIILVTDADDINPIVANSTYTSKAGAAISTTLPCAKGQKVRIVYQSITSITFRFVSVKGQEE